MTEFQESFLLALSIIGVWFGASIILLVIASHIFQKPK